MENLTNISDVMKMLKSPQVKGLISTLSLTLQLLPKFEVKELVSGDEKVVAVLFECTDENNRRVEAIAEMFTDILPAFSAEPDFALLDNFYSALLFPMPKKEKPKDGKY